MFYKNELYTNKISYKIHSSNDVHEINLKKKYLIIFFDFVKINCNLLNIQAGTYHLLQYSK